MAAGSTYSPIATYTVSGSSTNSVVFSSIPQTYTDLILICNSRSASASAGQRVYTFENSDFTTLRSETYLRGDGTSAISARSTGSTAQPQGYIASNADAANVFSTTIIQWLNYSNATTYKTAISRSGSTSYVDAFVRLWPSTTAISSLYISNDANNNWVAGSTFTLYGIASA
jgi:hypothetical protein